MLDIVCFRLFSGIMFLHLGCFDLCFTVRKISLTSRQVALEHTLKQTNMLGSEKEWAQPHYQGQLLSVLKEYMTTYQHNIYITGPLTGSWIPSI